VTGPATAVEAIAAGKQGALDIDYYLTGAADLAHSVTTQKRRRVPFLGIPAETKIANHRVPTPFLDMEQRRTNFDRVELDYTRSRRKKEAQRCLRCDICIRCGACERVCRDTMQVYALKFTQISTTERMLSDYGRAQNAASPAGPAP